MGSALKGKNLLLKEQIIFINPFALRTAKTLWSFGCTECKRDNENNLHNITLWSFCHSECKRLRVDPFWKGFLTQGSKKDGTKKFLITKDMIYSVCV